MVKDRIVKPLGKMQISKVFMNRRTGQISLALPKKKLPLGYVPKRIEVTYW